MPSLNVKHLIILAFLLPISLNGQDLIVNNEGDSLNVKITKVETDYIYYVTKKNAGILNTLLPLTQVKHYEYGFYPASDLPENPVEPRKIFPRFRAAINGGWSYRISPVSDELTSDVKEYVKELKSGLNYSLDLTYYFASHSGVGFKYSAYRSKNKLEDAFITLPDGSFVIGEVSNDITINFFGPYYSARLLNQKKTNSFLINLGLGYMTYKDERVIYDDFEITGQTAGLLMDLGYDIGLSKNLAMGFQLSFVGGTLFQYEITDGSYSETVELDEEEWEGLARIDLSVGIRFIK